MLIGAGNPTLYPNWGVPGTIATETASRYVGRQQAEINAALLRQMDVRRGVAAPRRRLEKDLIAALEEHIGQRCKDESCTDGSWTDESCGGPGTQFNEGGPRYCRPLDRDESS